MITERSTTRLTSLGMAGLGLVIGLCIFTAGSVLLGGTAWAATAGRAHIVNQDEVTPLNSGGSRTLFGVAPPIGARCAGDSTKTPWYRVYSYMVPKGTSPVSINFGNGRPSRYYGLYDDTGYWGAVNTARGTGQLVGLSNQLSFYPFKASDLISVSGQTATWEAGLACTTYEGVVSAYWNVEIAFKVSPSDPQGFTWAVTSHVSSSGNDVPFEAAAIAVALVLAIAAYLLLRSRKSLELSEK